MFKFFSVNITNLHIGIIANVSIMGVNKFKIQDLSLWMTMDETQVSQYIYNSI